MNNVLIAIKSCHRQRFLNAGHRETWVRDVVSADVRFFYGVPTVQFACNMLDLCDDEVVLAVDDDYESLPFKAREICRWALTVGYRFMFLADSDTFIIPRRLLASGFEQYDYSGGNHHGGYASTGSGAWLSHKAMLYVAAAEAERDIPVGGISLHGDDWWIGQVLQSKGIKLHEDGRYRLHRIGHSRIPDNFTDRDVITLHDVQNYIRSVSQIHALYKEFGSC